MHYKRVSIALWNFSYSSIYVCVESCFCFLIFSVVFASAGFYLFFNASCVLNQFLEV